MHEKRTDITILRTVSILVFFAISACVSAQEEVPELITDRPDQTESSAVMPFKSLQTESGFLSGLAELVGALLGYFILRNVFNDSTFGVIFAGVAGIMVYISLDELLPTAEEYGEHHIAIGGLI